MEILVDDLSRILDYMLRRYSSRVVSIGTAEWIECRIIFINRFIQRNLKEAFGTILSVI